MSPFSGARGAFVPSEAGFGQHGYARTLTPEAEAELRAQVAAAYRVEPGAIELLEVLEFEDWTPGDECFGHVYLRYHPVRDHRAIWGICGPEDRGAHRFVAFLD